MTKVTHTCDRCKKEWDEKDLAHLTVQSRGIKITNSAYFQSPIEIDLCKDCLEELGFIVSQKSSQSDNSIAAENRKTLEDKITDILVDLGVQFEE